MKSYSFLRYLNSLIGAEVSSLTHYLDHVIFYKQQPKDNCGLFEYIDNQSKEIVENLDCSLNDKATASRAIVLNGTLNFERDIEALLSNLHDKLYRSDRIVVVIYNSYYRYLYKIAEYMRLHTGEVPSTFITAADLDNFMLLTGLQITRIRPCGFLPWHLFGVGTLINRFFASIPLIRRLSLVWIISIRAIKPETSKPNLSVVIPARNEKGNIEPALNALLNISIRNKNMIEDVIFVEGHSSDGTWEEILRVSKLYADQINIKCFKQSGKGKANAVHLGFSKAEGALLTILDADLTMPPEMIERFYQAWCNGLADFINGNRLLYPMEKRAMRFINWLGNIFFAKTLSFVLDAHIGDSLCGTKLFSASDYRRFCLWKKDFGDFDPFGDFELLFPACELGLKVIDIPISYRDRVYGTTNIQRFYHGLLLLKMTCIGYLRLKIGRLPNKNLISK